MAIPRSLRAPYLEELIDDKNIITRAWQEFFRLLLNIIEPLGVEKSFTLLNNQASSVFIEGFRFDSTQVRQAFIDYNIQRTTNLDEFNESGLFKITYRPQVNLWQLEMINQNTPDDSGVTFSIDADGRIKYTSTNYGTTTSVFTLSVRARALSGKNTL